MKRNPLWMIFWGLVFVGLMMGLMICTACFEGSCVSQSQDICTGPVTEPECLAAPEEKKPVKFYPEKSCEDLRVPRVSYEEFFGHPRPPIATLEALCGWYEAWKPFSFGNKTQIGIWLELEGLCDHYPLRQQNPGLIDEEAFQENFLEFAGWLLERLAERNGYLDKPIRGSQQGSFVEFKHQGIVFGTILAKGRLEEGWLTIENVRPSERYPDDVWEILVTDGEFSGTLNGTDFILEFDRDSHRDQQDQNYQFGYLLEKTGQGYVEGPFIFRLGDFEKQVKLHLYIITRQGKHFQIQNILAAGY